MYSATLRLNFVRERDDGGPDPPVRGTTALSLSDNGNHDWKYDDFFYFLFFIELRIGLPVDTHAHRHRRIR